MNAPFHRTLAGAIALSLAIAPVAAHAQGTGRSMDIPVSIRSIGMGGASNGIFWDELDHWGNPALLGYAQGIRYEHGRTQLVPGLASDVILYSDVVQAGGGGVGFVFSGRPLHPGGVLLDYGQSEGRDENGNLVSTFGSYESVKSWGVGIGVMRAIESVASLRGKAINWSRYGDVSLGMNRKNVTIVLAPGDSGRGSTSAQDWGVHIRATPIDLLETGPVPVRVDLAYGISVLSYDDATVLFPNSSGPSPVTKHDRRGGALRVGVGRIPLPANAGPLTRAFLRGLAPLVAISAASDHDDLSGGFPEDKTEGSGYEISMANVVAYRWGHYRDPLAVIDDDTSGWSVGLPLGSLGGFRYDEGRWPLAAASGLPDVTRKQFVAWIDPIEVWRVLGVRR